MSVTAVGTYYVQIYVPALNILYYISLVNNCIFILLTVDNILMPN